MRRGLDVKSLLGESLIRRSPRVLSEMNDLPISAYKSPWDSIVDDDSSKIRKLSFDRTDDLCDFLLACIEIRSLCACECIITVSGNDVSVKVDDQVSDTDRFVTLLDGIINESRHISRF